MPGLKFSRGHGSDFDETRQEKGVKHLWTQNS
jgi:hypothetical protein